MNTLLRRAGHDLGELYRRDDAPRPGHAHGRSDARGRGHPPGGTRLPTRRPILPAHVAGGEQLLHDLACMRQHIVLPLARTVGTLAPHKPWFSYGYRNLADFARECFHKSGRWFRDLGRLHATLDKFPQLGLAVSGTDGGRPISQKAALCIGRVAIPDDVALWIGRARQLSLSALQRAVETAGAQNTASAEGASSEACGNPVAGASSDARVTIRLAGPPEAKIALDAVKALHAAVVGRELGTEALIEAMLGEAASAGWSPLDEFQARLRHRFESVLRSRESSSPRSWEEPSTLRNLERSAASAESRGATALLSPAMRRARRMLDEFHVLQRRLARLEPKLQTAPSEALQASKTRARDIRRLVGILRKLVELHDSVERVMSDLLLEMHEHKAWKSLGFSGLEAYAEESLGLGRSTARRRVSLARQLRRHGSVRQAYDTGLLGEEAAQWVSRRLENEPVDPKAEKRWIAHATEVTVKRLRDEAALLRREKLLVQVALARAMTGQKNARRVPGSDSTAMRDVRSNSKREGLQLPDDATWHASLHRATGETRDWIIELEHGLLERVVRGGPITEAPIVLSLAPETAAEFLACIESVRRELSEVRELSPANESRLRPSATMAWHFVGRGEPVPTWVGFLGWLEECAWVWDEPCSLPRRPYDRVYRRDGFRCMAPGCTARAKLEAHHLQYRSRGGGDELENLLVLCLFHHQQGEHGVLARARGRAPLGVIWRLGATEFSTWWGNERLLGENLGEMQT